MNLKLKTVMFEDGERFPVLVEKETNLPHYWATLFSTIELRRHTQNTAANVLRDIVHFLLWEKLKGRDLIEEFLQGQFLSHQDIISIRDHCSVSSKSLKRSLRNNNLKNQANISFLYPESVSKLERISLGNLNTRLARVADYLDFVAKAVLRESSNFLSYKPFIEDMKKSILAQKANGVSKSTVNSIPQIPPK
jgi:hypothetical protein